MDFSDSELARKIYDDWYKTPDSDSEHEAFFIPLITSQLQTESGIKSILGVIKESRDIKVERLKPVDPDYIEARYYERLNKARKICKRTQK